MSARPVNPFILGTPTSASKFIGRRAQVNTILSQLANPSARGSSAISGERRIGKTSLLHYIASPEAAMRYNLPPDQFVFVSVDGHALDNYMNTLGLQTFTEDTFWHYVAQCLAYPPQRASPLALIDRIPGFKWLTRPLERFARLRKQDTIGILDLIKLSEQIATDGKLVVLLLDEFEWIINNTDPQRPSLLNTLRSLINLPVAIRGFALITSSEEPLSALCKDIEFSGSPFPNSLVPIHLRPFSPPEAYELIDKYLKDTAVVFSDEEKDFTYDLSEGHPYWLQRVCFEIFNWYVDRAEGDTVQGTQITMIPDALDYEEIRTQIMVERARASIPYISTSRKREVQPSPEIDLPPTPQKFKIFVSSTPLDLQRERQAVEEALHRVRTASFSGMEYFGSRSGIPREVALEEVSRSDVYIGFFAHRYGYIDPESGLSMTELEYRKAREHDIPCLIYMLEKSVPVLPAHIEQEPEAIAKLKALKQDLMSKHAVSFFTNPDNLAMQVVADINNLLRESTKSERLSLPSNYQLANLIRIRHETGVQPYILLLGSSLSLTPEIRHAVCESDDWEVFWTTMQRLSNTERRALTASPLAELKLALGYDCLAELAQAGYFNIILTANIDDALDDALRILPASEYKVLCHSQTSAQEIISTLSRPTPRVKAVKLHGDINAYSLLPLSPEGQFEFPAMLEEAVERLLSQDTILVGDIPYDTDVQRCIRSGDGALWIVVPEEPQPDSFLYKAKRARPRGEIITGHGAEFGPFFCTLAEALVPNETTEVLPKFRRHAPAQRPPNPFVARGPVAPSYFIGRKSEVNTIMSRLATPARTNTGIAICGERRIGKTSLLHYIADPQIARTWGLSPEKLISIFTDSQSFSPFAPSHFWYYILAEISKKGGTDLEQLTARNDITGSELAKLFDYISQKGQRVVLLLDEFEHVIANLDPDEPHLLYVLRSLLNRPLGSFTIVTASKEPLDKLCGDFWFSGSQFQHSFFPISLKPFTWEEANQLIDKYLEGTGVTFSKKDRHKLYEASEGHPSRLQESCFELFQRYTI